MALLTAKRTVVEELHKPARRNYLRRRVEIRGLFDLWQADLVEMIPYSKVNQGYKYLLTVLDTCSKMAWAEAVKSKSGPDITAAMRRVFTKAGQAPKNLQVDQGTEFYNHHFESLMRERGVNLYSTYSSVKASIVERFNRTLKTKMWKEFSFRGTYKWVDILDRLLTEYNTSIHRTTGMKPAEVKTKAHERMILERLQYPSSDLNKTGLRERQRRRALKPKFKVGDHVRLSKQKALFEKGYTPNWGTEIFRIREVRHTKPVPTYLLRDLNGTDVKGGFYNEELQKTSNTDVYLVEKVVRRNKDKALVKWLGFDSTHNSWINKDDVV